MKISLTLFPQKIHNRIFLGIKKIFSGLQADGQKIKPLIKNSKFTLKKEVFLKPGDYELTGWYNCEDLEDNEDLGSMNLTIEPKEEYSPQNNQQKETDQTNDYDDFFKE
jgi:hypothetical protein